MSNQIVPRAGGASPEVRSIRLPRRFARELSEIEGATVVRAASVQSEAVIAASKLHEVDYVTFEAMSGQAMLHRWASTLAGDDIILADDLRMFRDVAKIGKGEIIADLVDKYRRV